MVTNQQVEDAHAKFPDHKAKAAASLGINASAYVYRLRKLGLYGPSRTGPKSNRPSVTPETLESSVREAVKTHPLNMREAAKNCNLPFETFKFQAKKLGIYAPNPHRMGLDRTKKSLNENLQGILDGRHQGSSTNLKAYILKHKLKPNKCEICSLEATWNGLSLVLHLDHIDGDRNHNRASNLRLICPNCHSQTITYAGRNKTYSEKAPLGDEVLLEGIIAGKNNRSILLEMGYAANGMNYKRLDRLRKLAQTFASTGTSLDATRK